MDAKTCVACGGNLRPPSYGDPPGTEACWCCGRRYPSALLRAVRHPSTYAAKLTSGEIFVFSQADIRGDFVHVTGGPKDKEFTSQSPALRGTDIRIANIVWCEENG